MSSIALRKLLEARSVAIVGASEKPGSSAGFVVRNLLEQRFDGAVVPVHPRETGVFGLGTYPDLAALPTRPDAVVLGTAAASVPSLVKEDGRLGTPGAVVLASGFAETGPAGRAL